jgi:hypothetical protein
MKKFFNFLVLLLLIVCLNEQSLMAQKKIWIGAKAGLAIPDLKSSSSNPISSGWKSRLGPYFGAFADLEINKLFSIQTEINYSAQGGKKNGVQAMPGSQFANFFSPNPPPQYLYATYNSEAKLNYLEIPILLKADFPFSTKWIFFLDAGPYAGFLLNAKQVNKGSSNIYLDKEETQPITPQAVPFDGTQDIKSDLKKFNAGIQGGVGLSVKLKSGILILSGGGNYGFIKIQKDETNGTNNTGAATVTLGYLIKIR